MACAARDAKIAIITGDTKVVERGKGDGVFITTTGIGVIPEGFIFPVIVLNQVIAYLLVAILVIMELRLWPIVII